eukprot:m.477619 g.477619  ORF g.477619 m.477619 type:complete len:73 (-) comp44188_c0_seq1:80-298(-)
MRRGSSWVGYKPPPSTLHQHALTDNAHQRLHDNGQAVGRSFGTLVAFVESQSAPQQGVCTWRHEGDKQRLDE